MINSGSILEADRRRIDLAGVRRQTLPNVSTNLASPLNKLTLITRLAATVFLVVCLQHGDAEARPAPRDSLIQGHTKQQIPGWTLEMSIKDLGRTVCYLSSGGLKVESSLFVISTDSKGGVVTVGNVDTRKCFVFPKDKTKYFLSLMGYPLYTNAKSKFASEYQQSQWRKTRDFKVDQLPVVEYERHVLNPPPGRTRTEYQLLANPSGVPRSLYSLYNDLACTPAAAEGFMIIDDRVVITHPTGGWTQFKMSVAKQRLISKKEIEFPAGFQKVKTVTELFSEENKSKQFDMPKDKTPVPN